MRWSTKVLPIYGVPDDKAMSEIFTSKIQFRQYLQKPLPEEKVIYTDHVKTALQFRLVDEELKVEEFDPKGLMNSI